MLRVVKCWIFLQVKCVLSNNNQQPIHMCIWGENSHLAGQKPTRHIDSNVCTSFEHLSRIFLETPWLWIFIHINITIYIPLVKSYSKDNNHVRTVQFPTNEGKWRHFKTILNVLSSLSSVYWRMLSQSPQLPWEMTGETTLAWVWIWAINRLGTAGMSPWLSGCPSVQSEESVLDSLQSPSQFQEENKIQNT